MDADVLRQAVVQSHLLRPDHQSRFLRNVSHYPRDVYSLHRQHIGCIVHAVQRGDVLQQSRQPSGLSIGAPDELLFRLGGNYLLYDGTAPGEDPVKAELCAEKAQMIALFYDYIQANHATAYQTRWGEWKRQFNDR